MRPVIIAALAFAGLAAIPLAAAALVFLTARESSATQPAPFTEPQALSGNAAREGQVSPDGAWLS